MIPYNISSQRIQELLIDLKEPKTNDEIEYIKKIKENYESNKIDIFSETNFYERKKIVEKWRKAELISGISPSTKKEEAFVKNFQESKQILSEKTKNFEIRKENALKEINNLLISMNLKEYTFNGYYNSNEFLEIEEKVNQLAKEKTIKELNRITYKITNIKYNDLFMKNKINIFKTNYNINWKPIDMVLPKEFWDEYKKIKEKYNLIQTDLI